FKGWDKIESLNSKLQDSVLPAENTSIGIKSKVTFLDKFTWSVDAGVSAYTLNRLDSVDTSGSKKVWPQQLMGFLVNDKVSTHYYFAGETSLGYQERNWGAQLIYKRI